jgi:hypothetical protein
MQFLRSLIIIVFVLFSSIASARPQFRLLELPSDIPGKHFLTNDGRVVTFDWFSGTVVVWSEDDTRFNIGSPDGLPWQYVDVSPTGQFLGTTSRTVQLNSVSSVWVDAPATYMGDLDSPLAEVEWPPFPTLPGTTAATGAPLTGSGSITICGRSCPQFDPIVPSPRPTTVYHYRPRAINNNRLITGTVQIEQSGYITLGGGEQYPFRLYPDGTIEFSGRQADVEDINVAGDVLLTNRGLIRIGGPQADWSQIIWNISNEVTGIDPVPGFDCLSNPLLGARGQVAGTTSCATGDDPAAAKAFVSSTAHGTVVLKPDSSHIYASPRAINRKGIVAGQVSNCPPTLICLLVDPAAPAASTSHAVFWTPDGTRYDLNSLIRSRKRQNRDLVYVDASAINDNGDLLVGAIDQQGQYHTYLLRIRNPRALEHREIEKEDGARL